VQQWLMMLFYLTKINTMTKNIFQIKEDYILILDQIFTNEGEITPELEDRMKINEQELKEKSLNYAAYIRKLESDNKTIKSESKRLKELADSNDSKIKRLKQNILDAMFLYKVGKIESPLIKISYRLSQSVNITDESKLSDNFFTTKITKTPSKTAIKDAIDSGTEVKGIIKKLAINCCTLITLCLNIDIINK
jgi:hypothetical protein